MQVFHNLIRFLAGCCYVACFIIGLFAMPDDIPVYTRNLILAAFSGVSYLMLTIPDPES